MYCLFQAISTALVLNGETYISLIPHRVMRWTTTIDINTTPRTVDGMKISNETMQYRFLHSHQKQLVFRKYLSCEPNQKDSIMRNLCDLVGPSIKIARLIKNVLNKVFEYA